MYPITARSTNVGFPRCICCISSFFEKDGRVRHRNVVAFKASTTIIHCCVTNEFIYSATAVGVVHVW